MVFQLKLSLTDFNKGKHIWCCVLLKEHYDGRKTNCNSKGSKLKIFVNVLYGEVTCKEDLNFNLLSLFILIEFEESSLSFLNSVLAN